MSPPYGENMQYSNQFQKAYVDQNQGKIFPHEMGGRVRRIFADVTLGAEITAAEPMTLAKLPKSAVIMSCKLVVPAGTSGTLDLGWGAGEINEVADANGLLGALDASGNIAGVMDINNKDVGFNKRFADEVDIILSASVDTVALAGVLIELEIEYVID